MRLRPLHWLIVLVAAALVFQGGGCALAYAGWVGTGKALLAIDMFATLVWSCLGLWWWRDIRWVKWTSVFIGGGVVVASLYVLLTASGQFGGAIAIAGAWSMLLMFFVGLALIRLALSPGHPILGVARTLIDEAIRMKVAVVFIACLVLLVPILPVVLNPKELLNYRLKTFLTYSLAGTSILLSMMTVFLACGTITGEIRRKVIFLTMTKPVGRAQYLLGKWLGIALLNGLLLAVAGLGIHAFATLVQSQPARDDLDRIAADHQVMTARAAVMPERPADYMAMFTQRLAQLRKEDPERYGNEGDPLTAKDNQAIDTVLVNQWHTIEPLNAEIYRFTGLEHAKDFGPTVQLRFKPKAQKDPPDARVRLALWFNGRPYNVNPMSGHASIAPAHNMFTTLDLPVEIIGDDGVLELRIQNIDLTNPVATFPSSVSFTPGELEILYKVGSFGGNLARSMAMIWLRLGFLAMLGLAAGTFLGFPVACMVSLLVYVGAMSSGFLTESLTYYAALPADSLPWFDRIIGVPGKIIEAWSQGKIWDGNKVIIALIGKAFVILVPSFAEYNPVPLVADGRVVPAKLLREAGLHVGVVSTGVLWLFAWFVFRRRELATATT